MSDFSNLSKLAVNAERTVRFTLYQVEGEPVLLVASATEANKSYFNQLLKRSKPMARRLRASGMSPAMLAENREEDRVLFAKHVLRGWEKVKDASGKLVTFTATDAEAFLKALPNWLFDELRIFCGDPSNFLEEGTLSPEETEEISGNSVGG